MAPHSYNFEIAKTVLNDNDKNRLLCLYLNCDPGAIDWAKATKEFGAASVDSMRVMTRTILKKIKDAEANGGAEATPAKAAGGGKKRKGKADATEAEGDDEETPKKKRGGGRKKKAVAAAADEDDAEATEEKKFKKEASEELE